MSRRRILLCTVFNSPVTMRLAELAMVDVSTRKLADEIRAHAS